MIEIWAECTRFNTTSQRFGDQARMILKKGCFSKLGILEIYQQINREEYWKDPTTRYETLNIKKQEPSRIETQNNENRNTTHPNTCPVSWGCRILWLLLCRGVRSPTNECPWYDNKKIWWWGSSNAGALGNAAYPFIAIAPRSTLVRSGSTW